MQFIQRETVIEESAVKVSFVLNFNSHVLFLGVKYCTCSCVVIKLYIGLTLIEALSSISFQLIDKNVILKQI